MGDRKNSFHESKSSKGFRLRRGSDSSRNSRASSSKKSEMEPPEKPKSVSKNENLNVYVPALQTNQSLPIKPVVIE